MRIVLFAVVATVLSTGCATLFKSKQSSVMINSSQPGAPVFVDGMQVGVTPARVLLSNKSDHMITVRGVQGERTCHVQSNVSIGWVILDATQCMYPM